MKKRKGLKINFHLSNRLSYTLIAIFILVAVGVGVYAATYTASGAGHPYTEISTCGANQILKMNSAGTAWTCAADTTQVGAVTANRWCMGDGSVVQCSQIAPPTKSLNAIYRLNDGCKGPSQIINSDDVVLSSTCLSAICAGGNYQTCGVPDCYHCTSCSSTSQRTCTNDRIGYLVN